jgi:hypothetical protein
VQKNAIDVRFRSLSGLWDGLVWVGVLIWTYRLVDGTVSVTRTGREKWRQFRGPDISGGEARSTPTSRRHKWHEGHH